MMSHFVRSGKTTILACDINLKCAKGKKLLKMLNNRTKSWKWESVTKKRRQMNWRTRKILQVELHDGLANCTRQRLSSISHSCPRSVSKGVKEAPYWAVGGDGFPEMELHIGEALDSSNSRRTLRNYNVPVLWGKVPDHKNRIQSQSTWG